MIRFSNFMCCTEDIISEDQHEIVLLQDVPADIISSLDGSDHWKAEELACPITAAEEANFVFGGAASSWLSTEPMLLSDANPDSILVCDYAGLDDGTVFDDCSGPHYASSLDTANHASSSDQTGDAGPMNITAEQEVEKMIQSPTDPVGKFLRQQGVTARRAVQLNLHPLLRAAPKTPRQKYGPRHEQTMEERMQLCKDRNRAHAKATRQRKKLFEQILHILENPDAARNEEVDFGDADEQMSEAYSA